MTSLNGWKLNNAFATLLKHIHNLFYLCKWVKEYILDICIYHIFSSRKGTETWAYSILIRRSNVSTKQLIRSISDLSAMPHDPDTLHCVTAYTHTNKVNCSLIWHIWYNTLISWYLCILHFSFGWCCCLMLFYLEEIYISRSIKKSGTFHVCFFWVFWIS